MEKAPARDSVDRLSRLMGIEPEYHDIWGNKKVASLPSTLAILNAMGVPTQTDEAINEYADSLEAGRLAEIIPKTVVARKDGGISIPINAPDGVAGQIIWKVTTEDGNSFSGSAEALKPPSGGSRRMMEIQADLPFGYHQLRLSLDNGATWSEAKFIVAPFHCYEPQPLADGGKAWGITTQLYSTRSERNWGIGDFTDLKGLINLSAKMGSAAVGINPLHALFPEKPSNASPYSPSNRAFLNYIYIDIESVPEFAESEEAQNEVRSARFKKNLERSRAASLVDYAEVGPLKLRMLEKLHRKLRNGRAVQFRSFIEKGGEALRLHCLHEALQEKFHADNPEVWGWPVWPKEFRDPFSPAVTKFAAENAGRVEFYQYVQWIAHEQLRECALLSREKKLGVGIYLDLAVGVDGAGSEVWANQSVYAKGIGIGAPPDDFNLKGQGWGLVPMIPQAMTDNGYEPFITILRENMRDAGALRIDHVMGLLRLFWIPQGAEPGDGVYVRYPFEDLLGIVALESHRNECLVIGEDLGTVPDEARNALGPAGVLSYRLLYFEKNGDGNFKTPAQYPRRAIVSVTTHDLPTLSGYWGRADISLRDRLNLFPSEEIRKSQITGRSNDRQTLIAALKREGLLDGAMENAPETGVEMTASLSLAVHAYIARSPAMIMTAQLADILEQGEQVNLPGTTGAYPNWRIKLPAGIEEMDNNPAVMEFARVIGKERG